MACRTCIELERFLQSALAEGSPALLLGLTEAGKRNRVHQRQEKVLKLETDLKRHKDACQECRSDQQALELAHTSASHTA